MDFLDYVRFVLALGFVLGLIALCSWLLRRYAVERLGLATNIGKATRLRVVETRVLDGRRRLVLVRRDAVEHLLVIGGEGDLVVETGIPAPLHSPPLQPATAQMTAGETKAAEMKTVESGTVTP